jgi:hypothetical protein
MAKTEQAKFVKVGAWKRLRVMLDPDRFKREAEKNIAKATRLNAMIIQKEIRQRMKKGGGYSANAALTVMIKHSSKPLIGVGDNELFKAITYEMIDSFSAFIGVKRSATDKDGEPLVDVAEIVHEGATIAVSDAMRGLFQILATATATDAKTFTPKRKGMIPMKSAGKYSEPPATPASARLVGRAKELYDAVKGRGVVKPLKRSTTAIVIPGRPFIKAVFEDPDVKAKIQHNWKMAIESAVRDL